MVSQVFGRTHDFLETQQGFHHEVWKEMVGNTRDAFSRDVAITGELSSFFACLAVEPLHLEKCLPSGGFRTSNMFRTSISRHRVLLCSIHWALLATYQHLIMVRSKHDRPLTSHSFGNEEEKRSASSGKPYHRTISLFFFTNKKDLFT